MLEMREDPKPQSAPCRSGFSTAMPVCGTSEKHGRKRRRTAIACGELSCGLGFRV